MQFENPVHFEIHGVVEGVCSLRIRFILKSGGVSRGDRNFRIRFI